MKSNVAEENGFFVMEWLIALCVLLVLPFVAIPAFQKVNKQTKEAAELCEGKDPGVIMKSKLFESMKYTCPEETP